MLTREEAEKIFEEGKTAEAIPTDMKRIVIPAFGFVGGVETTRPEWGANGPFDEDVVGLEFHNPKDNGRQVLKAKDGVFLLYDAPGRVEKIEKYLKENPMALKTNAQLNRFIDFLKTEVANEGGKPDLWESDTNFAAGLTGAPAKEDIKPGMVFTGVKKKEVVKAFFVEPGTVFEGAVGAQTADKYGAYIVKDSSGLRMVQSDAFAKSYQITKDPNAKTVNRYKEM